jgi:hypothetical protein
MAKAEYERILRTYQPDAPPLTPKAYDFLDGIIQRDVLGPLARSTRYYFQKRPDERYRLAYRKDYPEKPARFGNSIHTSRRMFGIYQAGPRYGGFPFYLARPKDRPVYEAVRAWFSGPMNAEFQKFFRVPAGTNWFSDRGVNMQIAAVVKQFIDDIFTQMVKKGWDQYYAHKKSVAPSIGLSSKIKKYMDYKASWFGRHPEPAFQVTRRNLLHGIGTVHDEENANFKAAFKSVFGARTNANLNVKAKKFAEELAKKINTGKPFIRS